MGISVHTYSRDGDGDNPLLAYYYRDTQTAGETRK